MQSDGKDLTDDLRDLAPEDAQELSAFSEKRRWFEDRLKLLESLPPIYPFLHGVVTPKTPASAHAEDRAPPLCLPTLDEVVTEQTKRDELEEEILAFDNGELARIKAKTRAVTSVPLTPPSTRLVALALDLVVLVDRLLTLLRRRHAVLQLTALRIQWDEARAHVAKEISGLAREFDTLISSSGTWKPNDTTNRRKSHRISLEYDVTTSSEMSETANPLLTRAAPAAALSRLSSPQNGAIETPLSSKDSSTRSMSATTPQSPVTNFKLSLLQSRLSSLQTRHTTMSNVSLQQTVSLLDHMIDLAAPLKGLSGVDGRDDEAANGAVPELFLDMQDALEDEARSLGERINLGWQLRAQWVQVEAIYQQGAAVRDSAQAITGEISSGARAFDEREIARLKTASQQCTQKLDAVPWDNFVQPSNAVSSLQETHNTQITEVLQALRNDAAKRVTECKLAVNALAALVTAEIGCNEALQRIHDWQRRADAAIIRFRQGHGDMMMPIMTAEALQKSSFSSWAASALTWANEATELDPEPQCRAAMLEYMKLKAAVSRAQEFLSEKGFPTPVLSDLEHGIATARTTRSEILLLSQATETDVRLVAIIGKFLEKCASIAAVQRARRSVLDDALEKDWNTVRDIEASTWASQAPLSQRLKDLQAYYKEACKMSDPDRHSILRADLVRLVDSAAADYSVTLRDTHLLQLLQNQARVVLDIEREGMTFLEKVQAYEQSDVHHRPEEMSVRRQFDKWEGDLHRRIPLVSSSANSSEDEEWTKSLAGALAATELTIPPLLSNIPGFEILQPRLASVDERARYTINVIHGRVASALQSLFNKSTAQAGDHTAKTPEGILMRLQELNLRQHIGTLENDESFSHVPRRLPNIRQAQSLAAIFEELAQEAQTLPNATELQLEVAIERRLVTRLLDLGKMSSLISDVDKAISHAVDLIDSNRPAGQPIEEASQALSFATSHSDATKLQDDPRVSSELKRQKRTLNELKRMSESADIGGDSDNESVLALSVLSRSSRMTNRSTSNPLRFQAPTQASRSRAISENWGQTKAGTARTADPPRTAGIGQSRSALPRPVRTQGTTTKQYIANPKSRLDVAVGRVLNKLGVGIAVIPVKSASAERAEIGFKEWHDQSGKYWIGAEGSARLCFCRILRSQTVMVRVGGGWTELTRFLLDHYAELAEEPATPASVPDKANPTTPLRPRASTGSYTTPLSLTTSTSLLSLSPLRYLRKASDSPPIRDKERERFSRK